MEQVCDVGALIAYLDNWMQSVTSDNEEVTPVKIKRPVMVNGVKRWICAATEQEYAIKCAELIAGVRPAQEKHSFKAYADQWYTVFAKPNIAQVTAITYERQLEKHIYPVLADKSVEDITPADVQTIYNKMGSVSKQTKQKVKIVLNQVFAQAVDEGIIAKNPVTARCIRMTGKAATSTKPYTVTQMRYIAANIDKIVSPTDKAFVVLQVFHPLRLEEVLGLRGEDVTDTDGLIHIRRAVTHPDRNRPVVKETKTEQSVRDVALVTEVRRYIPETAPGKYIVGGDTPLSYTQVVRMCQRIQRQIGFDEKITPRRFRKTVLTDLYDSTKDIKLTQKAAGHTTSAMTLQHYVEGRHQERDSASPIASVYGLS